MHAHNPDQIFTGVLKYLGFDKSYFVNTNTHAYAHYVCDIEKTTLIDLGKYLCDKIGLNGFRYIGNPNMEVKKIAFIGHLYPDRFDVEYSTHCIKEFINNNVDVVLPLETIDWTIASYIRDGNQLGKKIGMLSCGHFNIEELGMKYLAQQIKGLVKEINIEYVASEDIYDYYKKGE